jgi:HAD superfamily hydrolase (TIGR01509 family)
MGGSCLVLDFDGTIVDTEEPQYLSWAELWDEYGHELTVAEWQGHIGCLDSFDPGAVLEHRTGHRIDPLRHIERRRRRAELQAMTGLRPGVMEWISEAEEMGLPIGIASSSPREWVEPHLNRLGLRSQFACVVCTSTEIPSKPAPDSYLTACTTMKADPLRSVAVEDSPHGVVAALSAGLFVVAVPHGLTSNLDLSAGHVLLHSLNEMKLREAVTHALHRTESFT